MKSKLLIRNILPKKKPLNHSNSSSTKSEKSFDPTKNPSSVMTVTKAPIYRVNVVVIPKLKNKSMININKISLISSI